MNLHDGDETPDLAALTRLHDDIQTQQFEIRCPGCAQTIKLSLHMDGIEFIAREDQIAVPYLDVILRASTQAHECLLLGQLFVRINDLALKSGEDS